jgi:signal transduction histidine kinase
MSELARILEALLFLSPEPVALADLARAADCWPDDAEAALAEAEQANAAKSRLLASVAHDFRSPLTVIAGTLELLGVGLADARRQGHLDRAVAATEKLERALDSLHAAARLAGGQVRPVVTAFPIHLLLEEARSEGQPAARARGLDFRVVPCRVVVRSDRRLLGSIVQNFVSNAIRYTPAPGRVLVGCRRRPGGRLRRAGGGSTARPPSSWRRPW